MIDRGAELGAQGVEYCVWSPHTARAVAEIEPANGEALRRIALQKDQDGFHRGTDPAGRAGDAYGFRLDGGRLLPDPASRAQRDDVHGPSLVVDPRRYAWRDAAWVRPPFRDLVLYELHVGTFTREGTFRSAAEKLAHLAALGLTAIELMPVADFPGSRNWGYDGVLMYAPARCYGTPDDLRALVDAAHALGLAVILDVVYNHFGPAGNYLSAYSPLYFSPRHHTPWGNGFNFDLDSCGAVRRFFLGNPVFWMEEYHLDGFRLDATHEIRDDSHPPLLAEMAAAIHARGGYVMAEDPRNDAGLISPDGLGFDAVWADDFHHVVRVGQTEERFSYFQDFAGTREEVASVLRHGWLYRGRISQFRNAPRGTECRHLPPARFIHCLSNHDQTGNRALGERLHHLISPEAYRALSVLLCLTPYTPLLFMGQEWAASTPFQFFTDHEKELGEEITRGRRREFSAFPEFSAGGGVPDPQDENTFQCSKLDWEEIHEAAHRGVLALYRACLSLRRDDPLWRPADRGTWRVFPADSKADAVVLANSGYSLIVNLRGSGTFVPQQALERVLSSEEARFGGSGGSAWQGQENSIRFTGPEALLLRKISRRSSPRAAKAAVP
ncbi:MAG: malto-oligosyltrehalose trehalohydrolase [Terrimicrobiaceae bacterium]|nr:malto-oligosyltrehalose trehalohydrolase [Terrimicrobiaceae bacterium]